MPIENKKYKIINKYFIKPSIVPIQLNGFYFKKPKLDNNFFVFNNKYYFVKNSILCMPPDGFYVYDGAFFNFNNCFDKIFFGYFKFGFLNSLFSFNNNVEIFPFYFIDVAFSKITINEPLKYFLGFPFVDNVKEKILNIYNDVIIKINDYFDIKYIHTRINDYFSKYINSNLDQNYIFLISNFSFELFLSVLHEDQDKFNFIIDNTKF